MDNLKEKTAKGLLWGAVNSIMTQVLMVLIGIVLGRLLSPAEYGIMGLLAIFTAIAGSIQESGLTAALTNLKEATHREYNAVFWFSSGMAALFYFLLFLAAPLIADFFHQPALIELSRLVFASLFLAGIGVAHAAYMFRNMMNREKALINTVALICSGTVGITLAFLGYSYWSLAWQQFVYILVTDLGRLYYVPWLPNFHIDMRPIRDMIGFSIKILITNIINQVNNNVLSFIFGKIFTPKDVGNYSQASKWNTMGYGLISGTIQQVAQPVLSSVKNEDTGRQQNVFRKMLRFTAFLSMPSMFGLALIADFVVVLLGEKWTDCVPLLRILCISGAFIPVHQLYQTLFISNGRSDIYMWCIFAQVSIIIAIVLSLSCFGMITMMAVYCTLLVLWTLVWQILANRLIGLSHIAMLKDLCPFLLIALACVAVAYVLTISIEQLTLLIIARVLVAASLYVGIMKMANVKIFNECMNYFLSHWHRKN